MCSKDKCERHEFDYGLCLDHLREKWLGDGTLVVEQTKPKRKSRKKKVDAEVVTTTDETSELEVRDEGNGQV